MLAMDFPIESESEKSFISVYHIGYIGFVTITTRRRLIFSSPSTPTTPNKKDTAQINEGELYTSVYIVCYFPVYGLFGDTQ